MNAAAPLWRTVHAALTAALAAGEHPAGTPLPSEARLAARFGVAIGTVRRAVDELVAAGTLVRQQGRGTFVPDHGPDRTLYHFFHVVDAEGRKERPETEFVSFRALPEAPAAVAAALGIAPGAAVLRIRNLQRLGGVPVIVDKLWLPAALFPGLDRAVFTGREGTVYGLYQRRFGHSVVRAEERLSAVAAEAGVARLLGLEPGTPVLRIERLARALDGRAVELRRSWVNTAHHRYESILT